MISLRQRASRHSTVDGQVGRSRAAWTAVMALVVVAASSAAAVGQPLAVAGTESATRASSAAAVVPSGHPWLDFSGRWERHYSGEDAATVNSGSVIRLRYAGERLSALFDVSTITVPPQLWVSVDGGPQRLVRVDAPEIGLAPPEVRPGVHSVRIDVKDTDQVTNRWLPPLQSAVIVRGFRLAGGVLLPPPRPEPVRMAFYGDSITEGIRALGMPLTPDGADGTRTYAGVTARAFAADRHQAGFGKQGVMRAGVGNVPSAPESFGYNFHGSPADPDFDPDVVVLLQGSNDSAVTDEKFAPAYLDYLRQVRAAHPGAWIFAMVPLIGRHAPVIHSGVAQLGDPRIVAVDTAGWLDRENPRDYTDTVHPTVEGHLKVAERLVPIIARTAGLTVRTSPVRASVAGLTVPAGHVVSVTATVNLDQVLAGAPRATGAVVVTAPEGFTVDRAAYPFESEPGRTETITVGLRGAIPAGSVSVAGSIRVLVDGQVETLPIPLTVDVEQG